MNDPTPANRTPSRAEHAQDMETYLRGGEERARSLSNRGPIRYDTDGNVHPDILEAYWHHGFYVFEGSLGPRNLRICAPTSPT